MELFSQILPPNKALAWISAGETLIESNQIELGEAIYLKGEQLKIKETDYLYEQIKKRGAGKPDRQVDRWLQELNLLDPDHPGLCYARRDILKALQQTLKRGWAFSRLDEIPRLRSGLSTLNPANDRERFMVQFYLSLLDLAQNNVSDAARRLDGVLKEKPNFFPALLAREPLLKQEAFTEEKGARWTNINAKLSLFSMAEIPGDVWISMGQPGKPGLKTYRATFRNSQPASIITLRTPIEAYGWKIFLEDNFIAARISGPRSISLSFPKPLEPGEHQLTIKNFNQIQ